MQGKSAPKSNRSVTAGRARLSSARRVVVWVYDGALNNIGEKLVFLRRFSGDTEQIAQTDDKGGRVSRSVWSAWSLLPLSEVWRGSKAGASSTHSIRFARFGSGYAGLGTDAPYLPGVTDPFQNRIALPTARGNNGRRCTGIINSRQFARI